MPAERKTTSESVPEADPSSPDRDAPDVDVCESRPGRHVFIESGNADGWIASDVTVEPAE